ncbi:MAG: GIY-YIG nuclease family protein [Bacteroidales bacterium]|nr:GIY-YIG nuclease family protein [Bacteroidales bacterium]
MLYFVYILKSEQDKRFYYGQTQDLDKRVEEHNSGKSSYTNKYIPWKLFAYKSFDSRSEAMKYERMLKNLHSKEKVLAFIFRHNFIISADYKKE